jgi:hypothetical protein
MENPTGFSKMPKPLQRPGGNFTGKFPRVKRAGIPPVVGGYPEVVKNAVFKPVNEQAVLFSCVNGRYSQYSIFAKKVIFYSTIINQIAFSIHTGTVSPSELDPAVNGCRC